MQQQTMQAAQVTRQGPPKFAVVSLPVPTPGPGQLLIRVEACGVNFSDVKRRRGDLYPFMTSFPFIPGGEIAGEVVAHGPGVHAPPIGSRVFALAGDNGSGGYAQFALSYAQTAVPFPKELPIDAASVLLIAGSTAKLMLRDVAHLRRGESVLIQAATGGVGSFAVQMAKRLGARVIAAVGHASKKEKAIALGADAAVVYENASWPDEVRELTAGKGVDVALESRGEDSLEHTFRCLAPFGRLIVYGAAAGRAAALSARASEQLLYAPAANQTLTGFNVGSWFMDRPSVAADALKEVIGEVLSGAIHVPTITTFGLGEAGRAHEQLESRATAGKLVIKPWS